MTKFVIIAVLSVSAWVSVDSLYGQTTSTRTRRTVPTDWTNVTPTNPDPVYRTPYQP